MNYIDYRMHGATTKKGNILFLFYCSAATVYIDIPIQSYKLGAFLCDVFATYTQLYVVTVVVGVVRVLR